MSITLVSHGFEEAIRALDPDVGGELEQIVETIITGLEYYGASITPVDTGAFRLSWRSEAKGLVGRMFTDSAAINPRSGKPVNTYAYIVDERVGLLDSVVADAWPRLAVEGLETFRWR